MTGFGAIAEFAIAEVPEDTMNTDKASSSPNLLQSGGKMFLHGEQPGKGEPTSHAELNRNAIAYISLSVEIQIADFREKVRGNNVLETVYRDDLLTALAQLEEDVQELLRLVSVDNGSAQPSTQGTVRGWLAEYSTHCQRLLGELLTPKNMAQASVPAGLTTALMGLGYAVDGAGGSFVGMVFGRYLLGDLSFGAATEKAFRHMSAQSAVKSDAETNRPKGDEPDNSKEP